jgi:PAT family beta-lactamase induction signal transducer AmpG
VEAVGWTQFFVICTLAAIPGMLLLLKVAPWTEKKEKKEQSAVAAPG